MLIIDDMTRDAKSERILARYAAGERVFPDLHTDDGTYDFSDCNLRGVVFSRSWIDASFRGANLEGADFSVCHVKTCDFSGAKLAGATFYGSAIDGAEFDNADLRGANFEGASAYGGIYRKGELPPH